MMQPASFVTVVAAIFHHLTRVGYENISPMTLQQEEGARLPMTLQQEEGARLPMTLQQEEGARLGPSPKSHEVLRLEQDFCPIYQKLSPGDQELTRQHEEGFQLGPSPKSHEVSRLERDFCPIYQKLSPGDPEQTYIPQNGLNSTHADTWPSGGVGDVLIWLLLHFLWRRLRRLDSRDPAQAEEEDRFVAERSASASVCTRALLLDGGVLGGFYERCIRGGDARENWRALEFVEGFSDDLLRALRRTLSAEADLRVEDCVGVGSMYESWRASKPLVCDLFVPFAPPEPYRYSFQLWCSSGNGIHPVQQALGRIQLEGPVEDKTSCLCAMTSLEEDVLCLLHGPRTMTKVDILENLLCSKDTPYLDRDQVMKWFRIAIAKAWGQISHKYEFELTFRNLDSPGALRVRFRSGKAVVFNLTPVVRFEDSDAYFVSHFTSNTDDSSHTYWPLCFAVYEKRLLKHLAKRLPEDSCHLRCLQIVSFLHKKQVGLTGRTSLRVYHLKTALLHLLLDKRPSEWSSTHLETRACDILEFVWKSLQKIELRHALIGNSRVPKEIGIPPSFLLTKPVNLFRPLALQKRLRVEAVEHFREMLSNAAVLIREYSPIRPGAENTSRFKSA